MANTPQKPHAILVAYPLQGHVIPSIHLAIKLASQGFTITFINTHSIHHHITSSSSSSTAASEPPDIFAIVRESQGLDIRYTTVSDGLPIGFDRSLNHDTFMAALLHVFAAHVEEAVAQIVSSGEKISCLVADTFFVWPSKVAKKFGLFYVSFWTEPALVFTLYYHMDLLRNHRHFACSDRRTDTIDYIPGVRAIEPKDMTSYLQESDTSSLCHQIISEAFEDVKDADFVLCNTVEELEPETIAALNTKKPFYAIGPIFPSGSAKTVVPASLWPETDCTSWLNTKPHDSVLYVSFGSYAHVTKRDLVEIAHGLLLSKVNFFWVLRPDIVSSEDTNLLPVGFEEKTRDRSMVVPWCDQTTVLAHQVIGGFLTHCGWNSILESVWSGVPLLCFPLLTDQFTNRKLVVEDWKIGINLTERSMLSREEVSENINRLMCRRSGVELRTKIKKVKETLKQALTHEGSSEKNMNRFVKDLNAKI